MDRILVVLPNWFGETLFATPFLRGLREGCPRAVIATLGWPQCREVLSRNPRVNELIDYDERGAHRSLVRKAAVIRALRSRRFDAAFILRKSLSRSLIVWLSGIPSRIGFNNPKSGWLLTHRVPPPGGTIHKAWSYLRLLDAVGLSGRVQPYEFAVGEDERRQARSLLSAARGGEPPALVVLHPGANWAHKRWSPQRFGLLGDRLAESRRARIVITGGPNDVELAGGVSGLMRHPPLVLAGRTSLGLLAACLEQADAVVSNDTGVLHVAAALRRPVVALYGPTSPQLTGPLGEPQRTVVLHHPDCCPSIPCYRPDHPGAPGMDAITVDEAYAAVCRVLGVPP